MKYLNTLDDTRQNLYYDKNATAFEFYIQAYFDYYTIDLSENLKYFGPLRYNIRKPTEIRMKFLEENYYTVFATIPPFEICSNVDNVVTYKEGLKPSELHRTKHHKFTKLQRNN